MISNYEKKEDFKESIDSCSENTLNFENCCETTDYINSELYYAKNTNLGLKSFDLIFITRYFDKLKQNSEVVMLTQQEQMKYYRNPKLMSYDYFQTIDYWYLILLLNNWNCAYEMTDLDRGVIIPSQATVSDIITNHEYMIDNNDN